MKKKSFFSVIIGFLVIGTFFLTGCGNDDSTEESNQNSFTIATWGYEANPEFQAMVEGFKKEKPDVDIKIIDIDASQYEDKITTMLASGDTTDVLAMKGVSSYVNYASKGQLVDLTEDVNSLPDKEGFNGNLEGYNLENKYYAMPFRKDIYMLFYNKDIFDEQGIDYPKNLTWEEYEKLAKQLAHDSDGNRVYGSYHQSWPQILLCSVANQNNKDLLEGDYSFLDEYLERWIRMQNDKSTLDYGTINTTGVTYSSQFETGKTAMMPMGSFYLGKLIAAENEGTTDINWGLTSIPQTNTDNVTTYGGPTGFAVNKRTKNEKLAREFVKYCSTEQGAKEVAGIGMTPAYQSDEVLDILYNLDGMPQDDESKRALNPDSNGWEMAADTTTAEINQIIGEEYDLIMVEDISVKEGLEEMDKRVQEVIKDDE